jgi:hypothetical protein
MKGRSTLASNMGLKFDTYLIDLEVTAVGDEFAERAAEVFLDRVAGDSGRGLSATQWPSCVACAQRAPFLKEAGAPVTTSRCHPELHETKHENRVGTDQTMVMQRKATLFRHHWPPINDTPAEISGLPRSATIA